jgi:saccharopine dehydrogenase-like NADP-dependent oxidoreductase
MKRAIVLGGGMVGSTMAMDLAKDFAVTVADSRADALERLAPLGIEGVRADLGSPDAVKRVVAEFDVVVNAISSAIGKETLRAVVDAGKSCCDITFMAESPLDLDALAKQRGACVVADIGVAPGVSNMIAGYAASVLEPCTSLRMYVGGVPAVRTKPFEYKAAFAPSDVIEEYVRPARLRENGRTVIKDALSEVEHLEFDGVGTLEAFNTDGLRTLLDTLFVPDMSEKTLRWPGHAELMRTFRDAGFFSTEPIDGVVPLDVTSRLLFSKWRYDEGEADLVVFRAVAEGLRNGRRRRLQWDMVDRAADGASAMSRTTGYPATIVARAIASGRFARPGVHPPEVLGREPGLLDHVLAELERRGVHYPRTDTSL